MGEVVDDVQDGWTWVPMAHASQEHAIGLGNEHEAVVIHEVSDDGAVWGAVCFREATDCMIAAWTAKWKGGTGTRARPSNSIPPHLASLCSCILVQGLELVTCVLEDDRALRPVSAVCVCGTPQHVSHLLAVAPWTSSACC